MNCMRMYSTYILSLFSLHCTPRLVDPYLCETSSLSSDSVIANATFWGLLALGKRDSECGKEMETSSSPFFKCELLLNCTRVQSKFRKSIFVNTIKVVGVEMLIRMKPF